MKRSLLAFAAALALSASAAGAAPQAPRLFDNSRLVTLPRISVEVIGKGPDLILIPGLASSREAWRATAERLEGRYRLHLIEVAGFAGEPSRANASGPVLVPTAQAIDAYIVANKLAPATVIGHSLGGTIALWLAENHPEHLKKVLLVDATPFVSTVFISPTVTMELATKIGERLRTAPPQTPEARAKTISAIVTSDKDRAMVIAWGVASDQAVVQNALADDMELDLRPGLAAIKTPVTLLYPDNTPVGAPVGAMDPIYAANFAPLTTAKLIRVDHSLHFIMLDQPTVFAAQLDAFLN